MMNLIMTRLKFILTLSILFGCALPANAVVKTYHHGIDDYAGTQDAYIWDNTDGGGEPLFGGAAIEDRNFNAEGSMFATRSPEANPTERATLVRFDDLGIPAGSTINSATLRLFKVSGFAYEDNGFEDPGVQMDVAGLLVPFGNQGIGAVDTTQPEYAGVEGGPTANNRIRADVQDENTYIPWTIPFARSIGPNYASASYDTIYDRGPVDASVSGILDTSGYIDFDVTGSFFSQFLNDKLYGWIVHGDVTTSSDTDGQIAFRDWEFNQGSSAPELVIDFTPTTSSADFDFDGDVDGTDFLVWQRGTHTSPDLQNWQTEYGNGTLTAVPEPTTLALLMLSGLVLSSACPRSRAR